VTGNVHCNQGPPVEINTIWSNFDRHGITPNKPDLRERDRNNSRLVSCRVTCELSGTCGSNFDLRSGANPRTILSGFVRARASSYELVGARTSSYGLADLRPQESSLGPRGEIPLAPQGSDQGYSPCSDPLSREILLEIRTSFLENFKGREREREEKSTKRSRGGIVQLEWRDGNQKS
jgi:hypothetical protein